MKSFGTVIIIAALIIGGAIILSKNQDTTSSQNGPTGNAAETNAAPPADKLLVRGDERHVYGDPKAPVSLTVFSDFQCPYCGKAAPTFKDIVDKNQGKVKLVFRQFPLPGHQYAQKAAEAAEAAGAQNKDKFWEMHDKMFANQTALTENDLIKYAGEIKLDVDKFTNALKSGQYASIVKGDLADAQKLDLPGTPSVYINDQLADNDIEALVKKAISQTSE
jgi:protein-disulfide isomerase